MENVAHTLCGIALADAAFTRRLGRKTAWWTGAVAANIADVDLLAMPILGMDYYQWWHRGTTHSLLACLLAPPVIALVAARLSKHAFLDLWLLAFLAYASHLLMDVFTAWGTMLLLPFDDTRFSAPWVFIVDLLFIAILSMPFWVSRLVEIGREAAARLALGLLAAYIGLCGVLHGLAVGEVRDAADGQGLVLERAAAYPSAFLPIFWNGVATDAALIHQAAVQSVGGYDAELVTVGARNLDHPAVQATLATREGQRFVGWWASEPAAKVLCTGRDRVVVITDLAFESPWGRRPGFSMVFDVKKDAGTWSVTGSRWLTPWGGEPPVPTDCPLQPMRDRD